MIKLKEIEKQSFQELQVSNMQISKEIYSLKTELNVNRKLEKPHLLRQKKKARARILTALNKKIQEKASLS